MGGRRRKKGVHRLPFYDLNGEMKRIPKEDELWRGLSQQNDVCSYVFAHACVCLFIYTYFVKICIVFVPFFTISLQFIFCA